MANCPHCDKTITPVRDCSATPEGSGDGISGGTWICPACETILGISEVNFFLTGFTESTPVELDFPSYD
jgi:phage terminase large subunit GpA-like protein